MDILLTIIIVLAYYLNTREVVKYKEEMDTKYKNLENEINICKLEIESLKKENRDEKDIL